MSRGLRMLLPRSFTACDISRYPVIYILVYMYVCLPSHATALYLSFLAFPSRKLWRHHTGVVYSCLQRFARYYRLRNPLQVKREQNDTSTSWCGSDTRDPVGRYGSPRGGAAVWLLGYKRESKRLTRSIVDS